MENQIENVEVEVQNVIELLNETSKLKDVVIKLNEVIDFINKNGPLNNGSSVKDIKSERAMNEDDAKRILLGDLKAYSNKDCAKELGLSYGQIYSCRKGFTFKKVYKEYRMNEGNEEV